jgi:predicted DNA-binding transcriptional regulator YafY
VKNEDLTPCFFWAAQYIAEPHWSPNQKIEDLGNGKIRISFTSSSEPELIGWIMWLGSEVKLLKPNQLVKAVRGTAE